MNATIAPASGAVVKLHALARRRYHRRRRGAPDPDAAWQRLRAATAAARTATRSAREFEVDEAGALERDVSTALPKLQIKTSLPLPTYGPLPFGPVLLSVAPRITLKGSASLGKPQTTVAVTPGQAKAEFEAAVATSFGKVSVTGAVEPGNPSKVGIKVGTEVVEIERRLGYEFCNGYGEMLANLTSGQPVVPDTAAGRRIYWDWITTDWRGDYEEQRVLWMEKEDKNALFRIRETGRLAAVQDMELFFRLYSPKRWRDVIARHKAQYGEADGFRKQAYLRVLYAQMKAGKPIGIPLAPPR